MQEQKCFNMIGKTQENKQIFFALYWGQNLGKINSYNRNVLSLVSEYNINYIDFLELKPLSRITEEDYKDIPDLYYGSADSWFNAQRIYTYETLEECVSKVIEKLKPAQYDYLRSKGYALPYMGLSIETLQEYGWIKIKE